VKQVHHGGGDLYRGTRAGKIDDTAMSVKTDGVRGATDVYRRRGGLSSNLSRHGARNGGRGVPPREFGKLSQTAVAAAD